VRDPAAVPRRREIAFVRGSDRPLPTAASTACPTAVPGAGAVAHQENTNFAARYSRKIPCVRHQEQLALPPFFEVLMFLTIAIVLFILWALGFFIFPVMGGLIHIVLIIAVIAVIWHFVKGRNTTRV
jgi:hypothetical protein